MSRLPEPVLLNIFSFSPSFVFYSQCKVILKYTNQYSINLVSNYYFQSQTQSQTEDISKNYLFLDYFLFHRHLLILDKYHNFENYLHENCWARALCLTNPNNKIIPESLRNIMRLSYFVICLRKVVKYQRTNSKDKIEQTNIGISFQYLIESINKESEDQTKMLKDYMALNGSSSYFSRHIITQ
jgi:hypothetical protein|tara:strand:- start:298 stop:849 length:552 start_codon:yes stop_codon:yes gene_type:complete